MTHFRPIAGYARCVQRRTWLWAGLAVLLYAATVLMGLMATISALFVPYSGLSTEPWSVLNAVAGVASVQLAPIAVVAALATHALGHTRRNPTLPDGWRWMRLLLALWLPLVVAWPVGHSIWAWLVSLGVESLTAEWLSWVGFSVVVGATIGLLGARLDPHPPVATAIPGRSPGPLQRCLIGAAAGPLVSVMVPVAWYIGATTAPPLGVLVAIAWSLVIGPAIIGTVALTVPDGRLAAPHSLYDPDTPGSA